MPIEIHKFPPMTPSRPCMYCLALQGGSVFADFDIDDNGHVFLVRISFDGYGCCEINDRHRKMDFIESRVLIEFAESDVPTAETLSAILEKYFDENRDVIWENALIDHDLLLARR